MGKKKPEEMAKQKGIFVEGSIKNGVTEEDAETLRGLIRRGVIGGGVLNTDDCQATYEDLLAKGVEFVSPPGEKFYGIEAILKDPSGTWFSVTQPFPVKH